MKQKKQSVAMWAGCTLRTLLLAAVLLVAGSPAQAFKKQFKDVQWLNSNVGNAEITHVMLTDTATIVTFHKRDTNNGFRFDRATCLVDDKGKEYRIMRSQGVPGEKFDQFFQKATNEANDFKLLFEPLPKKTPFFDLIEGKKSGDFQILGIHDAKKPIRIPAFVDTVSVPQDFIRTDTVCLRGQIEGYSRDMGFNTMQLYLSNELTGEDTPKAIDVQEDGTFEIKFVDFYPKELYFSIRTATASLYQSINAYFVPGCTTVVNIHKDWTIDYKGSDEEVLRCERLMMSGMDKIGNYYYMNYEKDKGTLSFAEMQEKLMGLSKAKERTVDYIAWRNGFNPWEHHLAHVWNKLGHARWIMEYIMDARFATYRKVTGEDSIRAYKRLADVTDAANWGFFRELPYNDVSSLTSNNISIMLNRYEFAPVLDEAFRLLIVKADYEASKDSTILANDMKVTGADSPSLWGKIVVLRKTENNLKNFRKEKEEQKRLVELRRETLEHPGLQANLDRLYAKELERQTLIYSLPDTEATRILRRMTDKYRGKYLLIDFWGMGCGPCRSAIEHSKELRKTFRLHPEVDFLFIAAPESTEEAYNNYVKENLDGEDCHLITRDEYNKLMELFQFNGIPHYETLDKNGNVVREGLEYHLYDTNTFTEKLKELKNRLE